MKAFFTKIAVLLAACLAATAFVSCDDTKEEEGGGEKSLLKATPLELEFKAAGETLTVTVEAENVEWTASTTTEWLTLADNSGIGNGVMKVTARKNEGTSDRSGTITLAGKGVDPVTIEVEQEGVGIVTNVGALTFTSGDYYTKTILVEAEGAAWKAATEADWIELTEQHEADSYDGTVTVAVKKNTGAERTGVIILTAEGAEPAKITVTQKAKFESELIGAYAPYLPDPSNPVGSFFITPTYPEGADEPTVDISFLFGEGATWPVSVVTSLASQLVGGMYAGGLVRFEFRDDGTVAAKYRLLEGFDLSTGAVFSQETYEYPNAETLEVLPPDVVGYYTENGKMYVTVDKAFLRNPEGDDEEPEDLTVLIEGMLEQYPELRAAIVSTETYYALPFKYEMKADGVVKLYVDKEMMLPFVPLLTELVETLIPAEVTVQLDPNDPQTALTIPAKDLVKGLLNGLLVQSETLEIGVELVKQV